MRSIRCSYELLVNLRWGDLGKKGLEMGKEDVDSKKKMIIPPVVVGPVAAHPGRKQARSTGR
jgi:hypothetical protein